MVESWATRKVAKADATDLTFPFVPYDLNNSEYGVMEWLEFADPLNPQGHRYRINATFFLSNYNCIFGTGCKGIKPQLDGHRTDAGCCEQGAGFVDDDDYKNVKRQVKRLTAADMPWDKLKYARENGWTVRNKHGEHYKTRKMDGACIFANPTPTDPSQPPAGCAFHVLAERTGDRHVDTKPVTCWKVPLMLDYGESTSGDQEVTIITAQGRGEWHGVDPEDWNNLEEVESTKYLGWWCTDTPDAYSGGKPAYEYFAEELAKLTSDEAYAQMKRLLDNYGERRSKMPGELVNGGAKTIGTVESLVASLRQKRDTENQVPTV